MHEQRNLVDSRSNEFEILKATLYEIGAAKGLTDVRIAAGIGLNALDGNEECRDEILKRYRLEKAYRAA